MTAAWHGALTGTHLGILGVGTLGLLALALATERHAEHLLGRLPAARWRHLSRIVGWLLLASSVAWAIVVLDIGVGITLWLGWLSVASLTLVFLFPCWPWQPPVHRKAAREPKAGKQAGANPPDPRLRRRIAAGLLLATAAAFGIGLARMEVHPLERPDAIQGQVGPWRFTFAEASREPAQPMEMDIPIKEFRLRFCPACDTEIRHAYLKVHQPRSARAAGMAFQQARWQRRVEIPLPGNTQAGSQLWLTVVGKDGSVHRTAMRMDQAAPATVRWFETQRSLDAQQ